MTSVEAPPRGGTEASHPAAVPHPPWALPAGLVLVLCLLGAGFALLCSAVILAFGPSNDSDWVVFVLTLLVLVPASLAGGRRLARAVDSVAGPQALTALAASAAAAVLALVIVARLARSLGGSSSPVLLVLVPVWGAGVVWAARRASRDRVSGLAPGGESARRLWALVIALACGCLLAFASPGLLHPLELGASLALAGALTVVHLRSAALDGRRRLLLVLDAVVVALVLLAVTDVSGYLEYMRPDAETVEATGGILLTPELLGFQARHHEGFWLGPLNDVLHGRAMLVDTSSQYGVGVFYFLALVFQSAPLGYGTLALVAGGATALQYALAYGIMRLGGCARTLAIPAAAAAVIGLVYATVGSPADYPNTGALRFGLPWLIVALAVVSARRPARRQSLLAAAAVLVGVASVWSFETFAYAAATFTAVAAFEAGALESGGRLRAFARLVLAAAAAAAVAHLLLAVGTRALAGSWPEWSTYVSFLKAYSSEQLYYLAVGPWSAGVVVALGHLASALLVAALVARRHELVRERRPALIGIAAASGLGIAAFTYFVGHSHPNTLLYTSLPAVVEVGLWVSVAGDRRAGVPRGLATVAVAVGFWAAALVAVSGWPETSDKFRRSALAHAVPDGGSGGGLGDAVPRLWRSPPSDRRALEAQTLLDRHLPPGAPALVIIEPELTVETLVRSDRVNVLPMSHPEQDDLVPDRTQPKVLRAVDRLRPGTLMLIEPASFGLPTKPTGVPFPGALVKLQKVALDRIRARFALAEVERGPSGLAIVRLVPRR